MDQGMEKVDLAELQRAAAAASSLLKVLANQDRLLLLCQMTQGDYCVSELEELTGVRQPTLSQQLAVLRRSGLVSSSRRGSAVLYTLATPDVADLLRAARHILAAVITGQDGLVAELRADNPLVT